MYQRKWIPLIKEQTHALVTPAEIISSNQPSFFINTPKIWNKLPSVIKDAQSLESFKIAI